MKNLSLLFSSLVVLGLGACELDENKKKQSYYLEKNISSLSDIQDVAFDEKSGLFFVLNGKQPYSRISLVEVKGEIIQPNWIPLTGNFRSILLFEQHLSVLSSGSIFEHDLKTGKLLQKKYFAPVKSLKFGASKQNEIFAVDSNGVVLQWIDGKLDSVFSFRQPKPISIEIGAKSIIATFVGDSSKNVVKTYDYENKSITNIKKLPKTLIKKVLPESNNTFLALSQKNGLILKFNKLGQTDTLINTRIDMDAFHWLEKQHMIFLFSKNKILIYKSTQP